MSRKNILNNNEYCDMLHFGDMLGCDSPIKSTQSEILKATVDIFKAESGQFCLHDSHESNANREKTALLNLSWSYTDQYIKYYHKQDPFLKVRPAENACRNSDIMPWSGWQNLEFYYDFLKPQKICHLLVMYLKDNNQLLGHIGLHRHSSSPAFSQRDLFRARFLAAAVSRGLRQKQILQKSTDLEKLLNQVIEISSAGIVVLDTRLSPVFWNNRTLEFGLTNPDWPGNTASVVGNRPVLPGDVMDECRQIQKCLRACSWDAGCDNRRVVLRMSQGRLVEVEIEAVSIDRKLGDNSDPFYFILIFREVHRSNLIISPIPAPNRKLTPKETEIANCIIQGLSNKEISNELCISVNTVASHVGHIFQKYEVKSRSRLINELRS